MIRNRPVGHRLGRRYPAEVLTADELDALLAACSPRSASGARSRALIALLARSGLRIGEALALRPSDIDLKRRTIRLRHTKSGHAQTRHYHPSADDALLRWIDVRRARGLNGAPLFCTLGGGPLAAESVRATLRRLASRAGIAKAVRPHGLRHSFAVALEQAGTPVTVISALLGHSSVAVTSVYLKHLTNAEAGTALTAVELPALSC